MRRWRGAAAAAVLVLVAGCADQTELVLLISSDLPVGTSTGSLARLEVHLGVPAGAPTALRRCACLRDDCAGQDALTTMPASVLLRPGRSSGDTFVAEARGGRDTTCGADPGEVRTAARVHFVSGARKLVRLRLSRACLNVVCTGDQVCDPDSGACTAIEDAPLLDLPDGADLAEPPQDLGGAADLAGLPVPNKTTVLLTASPGLESVSVASNGTDFLVAIPATTSIRLFYLPAGGAVMELPPIMATTSRRVALAYASRGYALAWSENDTQVLAVAIPDPPTSAGIGAPVIFESGVTGVQHLAAGGAMTHVHFAWQLNSPTAPGNLETHGVARMPEQLGNGSAHITIAVQAPTTTTEVCVAASPAMTAGVINWTSDSFLNTPVSFDPMGTFTPLAPLLSSSGSDFACGATYDTSKRIETNFAGGAEVRVGIEGLLPTLLVFDGPYSDHAVVGLASDVFVAVGFVATPGRITHQTLSGSSGLPLQMDAFATTVGVPDALAMAYARASNQVLLVWRESASPVRSIFVRRFDNP